MKQIGSRRWYCWSCSCRWRSIGVARRAHRSVGYPPTRSPYLDLEHAQELTLIAGQYHAHRDPADVGPQSGLLLGAHYEWRAGGPAHLIGEVRRISSDRRRHQSARQPAAARDLGTVEPAAVHRRTSASGLSLTGGKSWHHIVPEVAGGVGFISDFHSQPDYWRVQVRHPLCTQLGRRNSDRAGRPLADARRHQESDATRSRTRGVLRRSGGRNSRWCRATQAKSFWTNNPAFTLGLSRLF